ncbi:MAG: FAD-dependent oxidoreductase [Ruminococcaceae bacterium]|nr:FAD-dependent oxidoreductase [Oscillospiraceae bacterium]
MKHLSYQTDLCVVGGGLSGLCCAIAAARRGIKVILVQDRPVLGGNASSEIRMWVCGANGEGNRESGIVEELMLENYYQNPGQKFPIWDSVLYEKAMAEQNLTLLLNTSCLDACMDGNRIVSIKAWQSCAETFHEIKATYFADCSGDSILAPLSGAEHTYGREAKSEYGERIPPDQADKKTMGMSCLFQIRETDHPVKFTPPTWAYTYPTDADLPHKSHHKESNFWWIEVGGEWDCIHDTDRCRDELLKICYGVWDHMKNHGDHGVENWELEWIGFLPGKRESRRYLGKYVVTQNDVEAEGRFDDMVAYAGWTMDDHFPAGFYYTEGHPTIHHPAPTPWGLPLRCMISRNIDNLVFAGRNISVSHAALSSSRVMATCAVLGQALGTAVAQAVQDGCHVADVDVPKLQKSLMDDDCYLPWHTREIPARSRTAQCSAEVVRNGHDRGEQNVWSGKAGQSISYTFDKDEQITQIRLVFDSDLDRNYDNMPCNYPLVQTKYCVPHTLVREYRIEGESESGEQFCLHVTDNRQRFVRHCVDWRVKTVRIVPLATHGCEQYRIFSFDVR